MNVTQVVVSVSRIQLALNVDDLEESISFYSTLLGVGPAKRRPGYANFAVENPPLKLVLLESAGSGGTINHLGVEVSTSQEVSSEIARLEEAGMFTDQEIGATCCYATQDKAWATGPDDEKWEVYTVLSDADEFGTTPEFLRDRSPQTTTENDGDEDSDGTDHGPGPSPCCS